MKTIRGRCLALTLVLVFALMSCATMNVGDTPWYEAIKGWSPEQRANFFMDSWTAEHADYKAGNAIPNKSEALIADLESKRKILEKSRIPVRSYATLVKAGGVPDGQAEQEIIAWIRQLQRQSLQGGGL